MDNVQKVNTQSELFIYFLILRDFSNINRILLNHKDVSLGSGRCFIRNRGDASNEAG